MCSCFSGFGGPSCYTIITNPYNTSMALPGVQVNIYGTDFSSTALQLHTEKPSAPDFNFISAIADKDVVFNLRGDGLVSFRRLTIASGGLKVLHGGVTVVDGGMKVFSNSKSTPVISIQSTATSGRGAPVMVISSVTSATSSNYLMRAQNQGTTRFTIRADGLTQIYSGGLMVTNGLSVFSGGLTVTTGLTIFSSGLKVTNGVTIFSGGMTVNQNGATIHAGGLTVNNGY